jgi:hypothetical protein
MELSKTFQEPVRRPEGELGHEETKLLQARIKDLKLQLAGTPLDRMIERLYSELEAKGISFRPQVYLSDQWGCPSGVPVIGVPFYLADPNLQRIEDRLGEGIESEREILMYLRHEGGHAFNYAYKLYDDPRWRQTFGDFSKPYREDYKPQPFSRRYVVHISGWYAQKHPDEDFAETFAVYLTPGFDWRRHYKGWSALKKLEFVDELVQRLGRTKPVVELAEKDLSVEEMEETVLDHYRQRDLEERVDLELRDQFDQVLWQIFEPPGTCSSAAQQLMRADRQTLIQAVSTFAGVTRPVVRAVVDHLIERAGVLNLTVWPDRNAQYLAKLTALVTALATKYFYTDRFVDPEG